MFRSVKDFSLLFQNPCYTYNMNIPMRTHEKNSPIQQLLSALQNPTPSKVSKPPTVEGESWASVYGFELPRDEAIAIELLNGQSRYGVAKVLGLSPATVYKVTKTPLFQTCFQKMKSEFVETNASQKGRIEALATQSLDRLSDILYNSEDMPLVQKTAIAIVDRAGHAVRQHLDVSTTLHIDKEAGECIEAAFREIDSTDVLCVDTHAKVLKV